MRKQEVPLGTGTFTSSTPWTPDRLNGLARLFVCLKLNSQTLPSHSSFGQTLSKIRVSGFIGQFQKAVGLLVAFASMGMYSAPHIPSSRHFSRLLKNASRVSPVPSAS